jgi:hypothetical protein
MNRNELESSVSAQPRSFPSEGPRQRGICNVVTANIGNIRIEKLTNLTNLTTPLFTPPSWATREFAMEQLA